MQKILRYLALQSSISTLMIASCGPTEEARPSQPPDPGEQCHEKTLGYDADKSNFQLVTKKAEKTTSINSPDTTLCNDKAPNTFMPQLMFAPPLNPACSASTTPTIPATPLSVIHTLSPLGVSFTQYDQALNGFLQRWEIAIAQNQKDLDKRFDLLYWQGVQGIQNGEVQAEQVNRLHEAADIANTPPKAQASIKEQASIKLGKILSLLSRGRYSAQQRVEAPKQDGTQRLISGFRWLCDQLLRNDFMKNYRDQQRIFSNIKRMHGQIEMNIQQQILNPDAAAQARYELNGVLQQLNRFDNNTIISLYGSGVETTTKWAQEVTQNMRQGVNRAQQILNQAIQNRQGRPENA